MEKHQPSPESSSEECTVLEAPPPDPNGCLLHTGKVLIVVFYLLYKVLLSVFLYNVLSYHI